MFDVYPPLDLVHSSPFPPLAVHECPPLVVMAAFLSVPPLEVHQVFKGELEIGLPVVLGLPTVFRQFLQMLPQDFDIVVNLLSLL